MHYPTLLLLIILGSGACAPPPPKGPETHAARRPPRRPATDPLQLGLARAGHPSGLVLLRQGDRLDTVRGQKVTWAELTRRLARARVVFVGERHDHLEHHRMQAAVIRRLASIPGSGRLIAGRPQAGRLHVGLEMLYRGHAPVALRRWVTGVSSEPQFLKEVGWKKQWGMDFRYYRPVFAAARKHRLPMAGLNVPLRVARAVGRRGLSALTPEVRATLPPLHLKAPRHRQVFRALLGLPPRASGRSVKHHGARRPHGHPHHGFMARLFTAQVLRDEVMAAQIVKVLEAAGPGSRMVVIVGNGHLFYHTGVNQRLRRLRPGWSQATVICVSAGPDGRRVSRGLGDYLLATPPRPRPRPTPRRSPRRRAR